MMPKLPPISTCTGCLVCVDACPHEALQGEYGPDGHIYPRCETGRCKECGRCEALCPVIGCDSGKGLLKPPEPVAAWSTRPDTRKRSASGGVFAEVAHAVLESGGVVIGAIMDQGGVRHYAAETLDELPLLQGSKYLQSNTTGIYRDTLDFLKAGRTVLFSGAPCQVAGVLRYVARGGWPGVLYSCDVICHGVPSASFFNNCVEHLGGREAQVVSFRDKSIGWRNNYVLQIQCREGSVCRQPYDESLFLKAYSAGTILRRSCFNCRFAALERASDFSLADFWGVDRARWPDEEKQGISLVIQRSDRAKKLISSNRHISSCPVTWKEALLNNPRLYEGRIGVNPFPPHSLLAFALRYFSFSMLACVYANAAPKTHFWWWPYKLMMRFSHRRNAEMQRSSMDKALMMTARWDK